MTLLTLAVTLLAGCRGGDELVSRERPPNTLETAALLAGLREQGAVASSTVGIEPPLFLQVSGARYVVGGEQITVFEYDTEAQAIADSARISRDGYTIGTADTEWVAQPHLFRRGRLIVTYVGSDPDTLRVLQQLLGSQVAGSDGPPNIALHPTAAELTLSGRG